MGDDKSYEELLKEITHPKQRKFLELYPKYMVSSQVCEAMGIGESTPRSWYKDGVFNNAFITLKKEIEAKRLELYEKELDKRVLESPSKQSDILLMFGLKAAHPTKYRDQVSQPLIGNVTIKMDIPRPWAEIVDVQPKELEDAKG
jgi:hypothetical protein